MGLSTRRRLAAFICLIIMAPLIPAALLALFFEAGATFTNWLFDGRWLARTSGKLCNRVEVYFGVDAESEYKAWQERRNAGVILTKKRHV